MISSAKQKYIQTCQLHPTIPLFLQSWWLDIVCDKSWEAIVVEDENQNQVLGLMPYHKVKKGFINGLGMPLISEFMGFWLLYPSNLSEKKYPSFEKKTITALYKNLPPYSFYQQILSPKYQNWLPLHWLRFNQTTRYTYVLEDISDPAKTFANFHYKTRYEIRKAEKQVEIFRNGSAKILHEQLQKTLERKNSPLLTSFKMLNELDLACKEKACGDIYYAKDSDGKIHAAGFVVWDLDTAYFIFRGGDLELMRKSGAMSLLIWQIIQDLSAKIKNFDFDGSHVASIEHFIRGFGAKQKPMHYIFKSNSILYDFLKYLRGK